MEKGKVAFTSRRNALKTAGMAALVAGTAPYIIPSRAQSPTLRILNSKHFVPGYDDWFNNSYVKEWGELNGVNVEVTNVGLGDLYATAQAEVNAQQGHDLFSFISAPAGFENQTIDHRDIQEECENRYGKAADLAVGSTFNPKTNRFFGICHGHLPPLMTYRKDLWDSVDITPDSWENILLGGGRIKLLHGNPVGISLAPEHNSNYSLRAIMYSFGSSVQDEDGQPAINSPATLDAIKYVMALYDEAMTEEVLLWNAVSNNQFMLSGEGSITLDTLSIVRAAENTKLPISKDLMLAKLPTGPAERLGPSFGAGTYVIWKFAENIEGAKQFLVDYIKHSQSALVASGFQNMPAFPQTVPNLKEIIQRDSAAEPFGKYQVLGDWSSWATNIGYPGYTNAAIEEVLNSNLIPKMFAQSATKKKSPEQALAEADSQINEIFQKWRKLGVI